LFGGKGLPPEDRSALENYLAMADPLLQQLDTEYQQWLDRTGVVRAAEVAGINDPNGEHSGVFVWRTIETERTFTQLAPPARGARVHDAYVRCVLGRHQAASAIYEALQVAEVRSPKDRLAEASRVLAEAESVRQLAERERKELERLLGGRA
jgi:hypothetical protein